MFFMLCMTVAYNIFEFRPSPEWWSEVSRQVHGPFLPCRNCNHIFFFKVVQNLFYQTLECAGPKKKFFEDSTLKAQNSIANFDIKANKARHPLASTRFFTELLEFRDKREEKKKKKNKKRWSGSILREGVLSGNKGGQARPWAQCLLHHSHC